MGPIVSAWGVGGNARRATPEPCGGSRIPAFCVETGEGRHVREWAVGRGRRRTIGGVILGLAMGVALGVSLDNPALGAGLAVAFAVAFGAGFGGRTRG